MSLGQNPYDSIENGGGGLNELDRHIMNKRAKKKPPIGIMPKKHWEEHRRMDLAEAICRYAYNYKKVPNEWIVELE